MHLKSIYSFYFNYSISRREDIMLVKFVLNFIGSYSFGDVRNVVVIISILRWVANDQRRLLTAEKNVVWKSPLGWRRLLVSWHTCFSEKLTPFHFFSRFSLIWGLKTDNFVTNKKTCLFSPVSTYYNILWRNFSFKNMQFVETVLAKRSPR